MLPERKLSKDTDGHLTASDNTFRVKLHESQRIRDDCRSEKSAPVTHERVRVARAEARPNDTSYDEPTS